METKVEVAEKLMISQNSISAGSTVRENWKTDVIAIDKKIPIPVNKDICNDEVQKPTKNELESDRDGNDEHNKKVAAVVENKTINVQNELDTNDSKKDVEKQENLNGNSGSEESRNAATCSSDLICANEAAGFTNMESKETYRDSFVEISEDSEEDSDSWEDESDSSTSSSSSTSTSSSSSFASDEDSDFDNNASNKESSKKSSPRTRGELTLDDLPPIENLHITVPKTECIELGQVASIVEQLVVVQANKDTPALDLDSVLFLKEGEQMLGHVFDVFGPVKEPCYCVRFNSAQHVVEHGVKVGMKVYFAPNLQEHSHFVFLSELLKQKGSDASWEHNNEPPPSFMEYSDDEEERKAKQLAKSQRKQGKDVPDQDPKKKHHTYEQRMNARNLRISERHRNVGGNTTGSASGASNLSSTSFCRLQGRTDFIRPGNSQNNNLRPWGHGPGQVRQDDLWRNGSTRNIPPPLSGSPNLVRPPAFSMPQCMLSPPPPLVPLPTTLLQQSQNSFLPTFNANVPPPPFPPPATQGNSSLLTGQNTVFQSHSRSESVPQGLHLGNTIGYQYGPNQISGTSAIPQSIYRSESMPSLLSMTPPHRFFPTPQHRQQSFEGITFNNPGAVLNNPPLRPMFPTPPPMTPPLFQNAPPPRPMWNENCFRREN